MLRGFLQKDEDQWWELFEDLVEKTIQLEPTPDKSRNSNLKSSKGCLHSIKTSIAAEAKLASVMRRLEALEIKKTISVNQVSPKQTPTLGYTYYQVMNHVFEEYPVILAHQMLLEHMNASFSQPNNNPYRKHTIPAGEII